MTAEQLKAARAVDWRQNHNPVLTLEDARSWFEQHPLSLFLPRQAQLPAPAPSFVEACLGETNATPPRAAIEQALEFVARLIDSGTIVALNLLGAVGEQPDFLASRQALPWIISLRGERDWKQAPHSSGGHRVSPLVIDLWNALEREGPLTARAAQEKLGRELTEAAVLRALTELWQSLRVSPSLKPNGQPASWEPLQLRHRQALATGSTTSQVTAISLLISTYLQSVIAASSNEIEVFLSPLVSRSRIREAVRGLLATRQILSLSLDAETYYFLEGGLPEFEPAAAPIEKPLPERSERIEPRRPPAKFARSPARPSFRPAASRAKPPLRAGRQDWEQRRPAGARAEKPSRGGWKRPASLPPQDRRQQSAAGSGSTEIPGKQRENRPERRWEQPAKWQKFPQKPPQSPPRRWAEPPTGQRGTRPGVEQAADRRPAARSSYRPQGPRPPGENRISKPGARPGAKPGLKPGIKPEWKQKWNPGGKPGAWRERPDREGSHRQAAEGKPAWARPGGARPAGTRPTGIKPGGFRPKRFTGRSGPAAPGGRTDPGGLTAPRDRTTPGERFSPGTPPRSWGGKSSSKPRMGDNRPKTGPGRSSYGKRPGRHTDAQDRSGNTQDRPARFDSRRPPSRSNSAKPKGNPRSGNPRGFGKKRP